MLKSKRCASMCIWWTNGRQTDTLQWQQETPPPHRINQAPRISFGLLTTDFTILLLLVLALTTVRVSPRNSSSYCAQYCSQPALWASHCSPDESFPSIHVPHQTSPQRSSFPVGNQSHFPLTALAICHFQPNKAFCIWPLQRLLFRISSRLSCLIAD